MSAISFNMGKTTMSSINSTSAYSPHPEQWPDLKQATIIVSELVLLLQIGGGTTFIYKANMIHYHYRRMEQWPPPTMSLLSFSIGGFCRKPSPGLHGVSTWLKSVKHGLAILLEQMELPKTRWPPQSTRALYADPSHQRFTKLTTGFLPFDSH